MSHQVLRAKVGELALLQDHHVLPDGVQVSHELLHSDFLTENTGKDGVFVFVISPGPSRFLGTII